MTAGAIDIPNEGAQVECLWRVRPNLWITTVLMGLMSALLACASSSTPSEPGGAAGPIPVVVVLGDSLTAGPGLRPEETYPALLQRKARDAGYPHRIANAGVSGDTSADALRRLDRALEPNATVLVVAVGANDGLRGVPVNEVKRNVAQIIERGKARNMTVLLCGMDTPPYRGWQYTLDFHRIFPDLAAEYGVPLMPFLLVGVVGNPDLNLPDGVHPNAAGMRIIADAMWPYLEPLLK